MVCFKRLFEFKRRNHGAFKGKKTDESWQHKSQYTTGDKDDFPSWITTNLINLKTIQTLGTNIIKSEKKFIIVDSFPFHNKPIPPIKSASKWLKELSDHSNFGYIPLYEELNNSTNAGDSPRWKYDSHFNELGNEIFASSIFNYLKNLN